MLKSSDRIRSSLAAALLAGCVPVVVKKFSGTIKGIYFKSGSAKILPRSFAFLDAAAKTLGEWPEIRLQIEGHTDDKGNDDANMKLSQARADSVKASLLAKYTTIPADQISTKGFGWDRPADPEDPGNHARNRRVEVKVYPLEAK